jgi:hypothetical protein
MSPAGITGDGVRSEQADSPEAGEVRNSDAVPDPRFPGREGRGRILRRAASIGGAREGQAHLRIPTSRTFAGAMGISRQVLWFLI